MEYVYAESGLFNSEQSVVTSDKFYSSPEERREVGFGTQVTEWLSISGQFEAERNTISTRFIDGLKESESDQPTLNLQLGLSLTPVEWLEADFIFESEYDLEAQSGERSYSEMDEGYVSVELDDWRFKVGRQYLPFGQYYAHFIEGPLLEFGETRKTSLLVGYSFSDTIDAEAFMFEGDVDNVQHTESYDWGVNIETSLRNQSIILGVGYLSDLAESDEHLLDEARDFGKQVSAWNTYARIGLAPLELTAEWVGANRDFAELDTRSNKPSAYNIELAYFLSDTLKFATRFERSKKLEGKPEKRYGLAATWYIGEHLSLSFDYLHGRYQPEFAFDDNNNALQHETQYGVSLSVEY